MTLPQGALWQRMRQQALDAIPPGTVVDFRAPLTLGAWQAQGTYTVSSASSSKFTIGVAPADFGGALLADAAFHLDHALEHQASLMKGLATGQWTSAAWQVVTFYYWAYFSAMALSRLLGQTVWFVTADVAKQFNTLAPTNSASFTKGTYEVRCDRAINAGFRQIQLSKRSRRVHEQLWATVFNFFSDLYNSVGAGGTSPEEERLFLAIINSAQVLSSDWPSTLRNVVNYRPGFAYTAPRFRNSIDSFSYLGVQGQAIDSIVDRLESGNVAMRAHPSVETHPKIAAKMLADLTFLLNRLAHTLHDEVVDRCGIDRRWLMSKRRFSTQQGLVPAGMPWPC